MRSVSLWIGKTDDAPVPPRIRVRIFLREGGRCWISGRPITPGDRWELDHKVALCNGGRHSEDNLAPVLADKHKAKTAVDVAEKSAVYQKRRKHLGVKKKRSGFLTNRDGPFKARIGGGFDRRTER